MVSEGAKGGPGEICYAVDGTDRLRRCSCPSRSGPSSSRRKGLRTSHGRDRGWSRSVRSQHCRHDRVLSQSSLLPVLPLPC